VTVLSTEAIRARLRDAKTNDRLIISPLLDEREQAKPGQAAIDVRLGFNFCLVLASAFGSITEFQNGAGETASFSKLYRREFCPLGSYIVIHPHQFILAQTLEYIRLPSDLMAYVAGRSTWGRLGLIVATAVGIHPGFAGNLTLELRNLGETPLMLYPGQTIAQLFFHLVVDEALERSQAASVHAQYVGTVDMIPRQISSKATSRTLKHLIKRFDTLSRT
jgi:dCTP deaminase